MVWLPQRAMLIWLLENAPSEMTFIYLETVHILRNAFCCCIPILKWQSLAYLSSKLTCSNSPPCSRPPSKALNEIEHVSFSFEFKIHFKIEPQQQKALRNKNLSVPLQHFANHWIIWNKFSMRQPSTRDHGKALKESFDKNLNLLIKWNKFAVQANQSEYPSCKSFVNSCWLAEWSNVTVSLFLNCDKAKLCNWFD